MPTITKSYFHGKRNSVIKQEICKTADSYQGSACDEVVERKYCVWQPSDEESAGQSNRSFSNNWFCFPIFTW